MWSQEVVACFNSWLAVCQANNMCWRDLLIWPWPKGGLMGFLARWSKKRVVLANSKRMKMDEPRIERVTNLIIYFDIGRPGGNELVVWGYITSKQPLSRDRFIYRFWDEFDEISSQMASKRAWAQDSKIIRKRLGHLETVILLQRVSTCSGLHVDIIKSSKSVRIHHDTPTINVGFTYCTIIVWYCASFPFEISSGFIQVGLVDSWIWLQIRSGRHGQNTIISGSSQERPKCQQWAPCTWCYVQIPFEWTGMSQTYYDATTNSLLAPTYDKATIVFQGFYMLAKPFNLSAFLTLQTWRNKTSKTHTWFWRLVQWIFMIFWKDSTSVFTPSVFWINHSRVAKSTKWPYIS